MPSINKLSVVITGDETGLKKATTAAAKDINIVGKSAMSLGKLAIGTALGQMLTSVVGNAIHAITSEMDGAISRLDTINNYGKVMGNLGIGADESAKSIDYLQEHLLGLPTSLDTAALAVQRFTAANGNINASTQMYLALNNAILAGGAAMETQKTAMEQMAQAYSKGKPDAMEWRALLTAMPAQMNQIAKAAGYTSAAIGGDFYEAIQNGKYSMNDFMATVVKLNQTGVDGFANFETQARNSTGGVQTSIANLRNAIQRGIATILNAIGQANIAGFINGVASAIGTVANYIAAFVKLIKEAVAWLGVLFGFKIGGSKDTANATANTATNLGAAAKNANATAGGLKNAASAAKKLNNQLAGFDEMNVLRETTSGGSGGGGGAGAVGAGAITVPEIDLGVADAAKQENQVDKILEKMKKAFDKLAKFLKPVAEVIADIWQNYLGPFLNWAGNELLPAFFNALGGALELLGAIIKSVWTNALKPLVDNFLVPIAQWTGGIIISVLNGIGDALSWLAQQTGLLDFLSTALRLFLEISAAVIAWNTAATFLNGILGNFMNIGLPLLLENTKVGMMGITAGANAFATAQGAATTATTLWGNAMNVLNGIFSMQTVALGALAAAIIAAYTAGEYFKLKEMEAEAAERLRMDATKLSEQTQRQYNDAINESKQLLDDLAGKEATAAEAELNWRNLVDQAHKKREEYNKAVKNGSLNTDELRKMELEAIVAENRAEEAKKKLDNAQQDVNNTLTEYDNKQWKAIQAEKQAEAQALLNGGKYKELAKYLDDLSDSTIQYKDANGNMAKFSKEDTRSMAEFISQNLSQIDKSWDQAFNTAEQTGKKYTTIVDEMSKNGTNGGNNFSNGIVRGIRSGQNAVKNAAKDSANAAKNAFNRALQIHSPSRVMAESGKFFVEGIEDGLDKETNALEKNVAAMGQAMVKTFNANAELPDLGVQDAADKLDHIAEKAQARMTINADNTAGAIENLAQAIIAMQEDKQPIVVKVGEETLVDTIVNGINNASEMRNRGVINI